MSNVKPSGDDDWLVEKVARTLCEVDAAEMYPHPGQVNARNWYVEYKWDIHIDAAIAVLAVLLKLGAGLPTKPPSTQNRAKVAP